MNLFVCLQLSKEIKFVFKTSPSHHFFSSNEAPSFRFPRSILAIALCSALAIPTAATADVWTGTTSSNWFDGTNWTSGGVPTAVYVLINATPSNPAVASFATADALNLDVGATSNAGGVLNVTSGTLNVANQSSIGHTAGSFGLVTVSGAGAQWNGNDLYLGDLGTGTLTIQNNGAVSMGDGISVADGVGSTGTLTMLSGGTLTTSIMSLGGGLNSTATATVAGTNSKLTVTGSSTSHLYIGLGGTGTLTVSNGGQVTTQGDTNIGGESGSTGTVTIDGNTSTFNTKNIYIGESGHGNLTIQNGGKVSNGYGNIGYIAGSAGTVTVTGNGSTWNNSNNVLIGSDGQGTLTIANGGVVSISGGLAIADFTTATGTLNIGGAVGAPASAPGTLNATTVEFGAGIGTINFNHTDTSGNYAVDAAISSYGNGSSFINQNAGWTRLTADSSGFTGVTNVNGGRLAVNGSLANSFVNVNSGGTLGGSGTVGSVHAYSGSIIAPGNSIGTLKINGAVVFHPGSIYQVEVDAAGQSDKIVASGTATLNGGTVQVLAGAGNYGASTSYSILTAQGGVTGAFAGVTSNLLFLDPTLSYDASNVYLKLTRNQNNFASIGVTPNQKAAGGAAESLGAGNAIFDAALKLSAPQARIAFDQLSGEIHASARSVMLEDSRFARDASMERLRFMDSESVANDGGADPEEGKKPARLLPSVRDLAYWARAMGSWGHLAGEGNAATVKRDTAGFLMGADTRLGEEGRFGLMGGYSRSAFDVNDRNSSGTSDNYHLGAYAGSRWGDLALRTGLSYSWHDVSTSRVVAFPGFSDSLKADYKVSTTQAFAELGYRIKTERAEFEPFANLAHVNVSSDGFTERGGAAALTSGGASKGVTFGTLGIRASTKVGLANGADVTARGSLGWRTASGDTTPATTLAFAGSSQFAIAGAPIAKNAAIVEAGLDFRLTPAATLGLYWAGQFGSGVKDQSAKINLNVAF